jgi:hypothetical protein
VSGLVACHEGAFAGEMAKVVVLLQTLSRHNQFGGFKDSGAGLEDARGKVPKLWLHFQISRKVKLSMQR